MTVSVVENVCPNCFYAHYSGGICPRCNNAAVEVSKGVLAPGSLLAERYIAGRMLGIGGFGVTYLALDTASNKQLAIKEYYPQSMAMRNAQGEMVFSQGDRRVFDFGYRAFRREAAYLSRFSGNEHVVQVSQTFDQNQTSYLVMEYLDGVNLNAMVRGMGGKLPLPVVGGIFQNVLAALVDIHRQGLIHKDISPENIYMTRNGNAKLIDFGAAAEYRGNGTGQSDSRAVLVKASFTPPEQYDSRGKVGPWSDIYSLAASLYYCASGAKVPSAPERLRGTMLVELNKRVAGLSPMASLIVDKALALEPAARFANATEFSQALFTGPGAIPTASVQAISDCLANLVGNPYIMVARDLSDPDSGERWPIPQNFTLRIGRLPQVNNVVILDQSISREHCELRFDSKSWRFLIKDVSTNGTYTLGGQRMNPHSETALLPGSSFYLAKDNIMMKVGLS